RKRDKRPEQEKPNRHGGSGFDFSRRPIRARQPRFGNCRRISGGGTWIRRTAKPARHTEHNRQNHRQKKLPIIARAIAATTSTRITRVFRSGGGWVGIGWTIFPAPLNNAITITPVFWNRPASQFQMCLLSLSSLTA